MIPITKIIDARNAVLQLYYATLMAKEISETLSDSQSSYTYMVRQATLEDVLNILDNAY